MSFELGENQLSTLGLIVGYNKSGTSFSMKHYWLAINFENLAKTLHMAGTAILVAWLCFTPTFLTMWLKDRFSIVTLVFFDLDPENLDRDSFDSTDIGFDTCRISSKYSEDVFGMAFYRLRPNKRGKQLQLYCGRNARHLQAVQLRVSQSAKYHCRLL